MKSIKEKKGFTLVELLAVIVVLALLIVLAMPTILELMENARKSTFQKAVMKMVNTAEQMYASDTLTGTQKACYTATELNPGNTAYKGGIVMETIGAKAGQAKEIRINSDRFATYNTFGFATKELVFDKAYCDATSNTASSYKCDVVSMATPPGLPIYQPAPASPWVCP